MSFPAHSDSQVEPGREMLLELVGLHAQAMLRMPWVQSFLVVGLGLLLFAYVNLWLFLGWSALTIGMEVLRARYARSVLARGALADPKRTHAIFVALAAASGLAIAVGTVMFLPRLTILDQALYGAILFAIPAAGVAVSQSSRNILAAYAVCLLVPSSTTWSIVHPSQAFALGALTVLYCVVIVLVAADGEKLLLRSVTIRHQRDRLVRDLEQRNADVRIAMAQAEQSAKARARVLAAASHDLRQPLHALSLYSAVLASNPPPDTLREVSGNIDQIVRALGNLLNGLLDLSRLSAGNYVPEHQNLAMDEIIAAVCSEYAQAAQQKGLAFEADLKPVRVIGDGVALGRITRNLIDNAVKYTEAGTLRVSTGVRSSDAGPLAVLEVTDTGKGIPESEQAKVFEEFYQLDNPGRDRSRGVGLGLAIVQRLCELIGATISLTSREGEGTSFTVSMPAAPDAVEAHRGAEPALGSIALNGRRVFVIDDERDIRQSMRTLLNLWGLRVHTAGTLSEGEQLFERLGPPDIAIVDLRLAESEHGAHFADRMHQKFGQFPVLIITGETSSEALREANARSYPLLQKPITAEVLRGAINAVLAPR